MYATCVIWLGFIAIYGANPQNILLKVFLTAIVKNEHLS